MIYSTFSGIIISLYNSTVEFGLITVNALLVFLDWLVRELEYWQVVNQAESLCEELDYLNAVAYLEELRQSPEYQSIRAK